MVIASCVVLKGLAKPDSFVAEASGEGRVYAM